MMGAARELKKLLTPADRDRDFQLNTHVFSWNIVNTGVLIGKGRRHVVRPSGGLFF